MQPLKNNKAPGHENLNAEIFKADPILAANQFQPLFFIGQQVGLKISQKKTEIMTINLPSPTPVQLDKQDLCNTDKFTYLGSILSIDGGAEKDIRSRLNKARNAFRSMGTVWKSSQYTVNTKIKLYKTCILPVLLYGSECWTVSFSYTKLRKPSKNLLA